MNTGKTEDSNEAIYENAVELFKRLTMRPIASEIAGTIKLAVETDDMALRVFRMTASVPLEGPGGYRGEIVAPWAGIHRMQLAAMVRNLLDLEFEVHRAKQDKRYFEAVFGIWEQYDTETVLLFLTDVVRFTALNAAIWMSQAYRIIETSLGHGDVLHSSQEINLLEEAREKWKQEEPTDEGSPG